ncbi:Uncharacterised protein [Atlantibacter hermannii]|nr:Uncharacterised protein [Atlantibacter hermannii]
MPWRGLQGGSRLFRRDAVNANSQNLVVPVQQRHDILKRSAVTEMMAVVQRKRKPGSRVRTFSQ